jgi:hypothetical protein
VEVEPFQLPLELELVQELGGMLDVLLLRVVEYNNGVVVAEVEWGPRDSVVLMDDEELDNFPDEAPEKLQSSHEPESAEVDEGSDHGSEVEELRKDTEDELEA